MILKNEGENSKNVTHLTDQGGAIGLNAHVPVLHVHDLEGRRLGVAHIERQASTSVAND